MNALNRCLKLLFFFATLTLSMGITRIIAADTENSGPGKNVPASNDAAIEAKIDSLLRTMTLDEKIGQMTEVDLGAIKDKSDIQKYFIGSVLSGGDSDPPDNSPQTWAKTYDELQSWALKTRLKIPLIYGIDAVHGHNNVLGAVIFPHNVGLGATRNPELVEKAARITALEVSGTGINWTFAPCIAVARNIRWGRTYESFGETPELAESLGAAAVRGFQGKNLADPGSIVACAKHYMGDGGTTNGKDQGNTQCDEATLRKIHLPGYVAAVKAGAGTIMASFSSWNGKKMHGNKYLLTDVLKNELAFKGFLVSDWAGIDQLSPDFKTAVEQSINAGMDMAMVPNGPGGKNNYIEFIGLLKELAAEDKVPQSRIDDAVRRILRVKFKTRLFEKPFTDPSLTASIGSAEHRQVARDCVRQSLVLLKNENHVLPLAKNLKHLVVAGKAADDLGMQCGGWTIRWQGRTGKVTDGGTTILAAIRQAVAPGTEVIFSADGENAQGADAAIVVVGESPYAEGNGDRKDLGLAKKDIDLVKKVKQSGVPVITVLLSGRPMILGPALDNSDAFIAAWLPGTEGQGVADVLFGDYKPTGKLPHTWPKSMDQVPLNVGDPGADKALFPYGFGLTY
ncbi:MAG: glycoside hydrolase family 3 N-terminal domain-containing protein [Thermoguttaceae bacterium]|jgi:beta-glucosidase